MAKNYVCPKCKNVVNQKATVCSNPDCRAPLAFCSSCRDIATYTLVEKRETQFARDKFRCDLCQNTGVKCVTWVSGGYCNGLARAPEVGAAPAKPFCAGCMERVGEVARSVVGWSIMGLLGGIMRPRK